MQFQLMPTEGDNILGDDRAIFEASLVQQLPLNFKEIIVDEIKIMMLKTDTDYPFPYLFIELCRATKVPKIVGVDENIHARKTHNPIWFDKVHPGLRLDRGAEVAPNPSVIKAGVLCDVDV